MTCITLHPTRHAARCICVDSGIQTASPERGGNAAPRQLGSENAEEPIMADVSFYGHGYCGDCDETWEFEPVPDGTILESDHECAVENADA
ncbi:hypothetical protein GCM10022245_20460 [Streptomyces mayteni]